MDEYKIDFLIHRQDAIEWTITAISVWSTIAGVAFAIVAVGVSIVGLFSISAFRKAQKEAQSVRKSAEETIASLEKRYSLRMTQMENSYSELEEKFSRLYEYSKDYIAGDVYYRNSDFSGALYHYTRAFDVNPENEIKYRIARCKTYLGQRDEALQILDSLTKQRPEDPNILRGIGFAHRFHNPELSLKALKEALSLAESQKLTQECVKLLNDIGLIYRDIGDFAECQKRHLEAQKRKENDSVTQYFCAIAFGLNGEHERFGDLLKVSATNAHAELQRREIKPLWFFIIQWSAFAFDRKEKLCRDHWERINAELHTDYIKDTVYANIDKICELTGINRTRYCPIEKK